jgi:hypothetical protein
MTSSRFSMTSRRTPLSEKALVCVAFENPHHLPVGNDFHPNTLATTTTSLESCFDLGQQASQSLGGAAASLQPPAPNKPDLHQVGEAGIASNDRRDHRPIKRREGHKADGLACPCERQRG